MMGHFDLSDTCLLGTQSSVLTRIVFSFVRQLGRTVESNNFLKLEWL